jgi:hypothetical protein
MQIEKERSPKQGRTSYFEQLRNDMIEENKAWENNRNKPYDDSWLNIPGYDNPKPTTSSPTPRHSPGPTPRDSPSTPNKRTRTPTRYSLLLFNK